MFYLYLIWKNDGREKRSPVKNSAAANAMRLPKPERAFLLRRKRKREDDDPGDDI